MARILAHGGIPVESLEDFFEHLLLPVLLDPGRSTLRAQEVIDRWRANPSSFDRVDMPVRRFLLFGGPVARDLVGRSFELAQFYEERGFLPEAAEVGLPPEVVERYGAWSSDRRPRGRGRPVRRHRLATPALAFDPWAGDALSLVLPAQNLDDSTKRGYWTASAGDWSVRHPLVIERGLTAPGASRPAEIRVPAPFRELQVRLEVDNAEIRQWRFGGPSQDRPLLAFRPTDGRMLDPAKPLPAANLWILHPAEADLLEGAGGAPRLVEEFPRPGGQWSTYAARHLNLEGVGEVRLGFETGNRCVVVPVEDPEEGAGRPMLVGGERPAFAVRSGDSEVFVGSPPTLRLPLPLRGTARTDPGRWRVHIRAIDSASPSTDATVTGDDRRFVKRISPGWAELNLAEQSLLGDRPLGRYLVTAHGPLGHDARHSIMFLPRFEVFGNSVLSLPGPDGPEPVTVRIVGPRFVEPGDCSRGKIRVEEVGASATRLVYPPEERSVIVRLSFDAMSEPVEVELPLRRLHWTISGINGQPASLGVQQVTLSRDELEQAEAPAVVVDFAGEEQGAAQVLVKSASGDIVVASDRVEKGSRRRFLLRPMLDSIRARSDMVLRFILSLETTTGAAHHVLLGELTRGLRVSRIRVSDRRNGGERVLDLDWEEPEPVSDRHVRLWPLWRPWAEAVDEAVPDDARGRFVVRKPALVVPPGRYRVELVAINPWAAAPVAEFPDPGANGTADVDLGTDEERDDYLDTLPVDRPLGLLELYLAKEDPGILKALGAAVGGDDVHAIIDALGRFVDTDSGGARHRSPQMEDALAELVGSLGGRVETLVAIADSARFGTSATRRRLRRLTATLRLLDHWPRPSHPDALTIVRRRALWELWPPFLTAVDGESLVNGEPETVEAAGRVLGRGWSSLLGRDTSGEGCTVKAYSFSGQALAHSARDLEDKRAAMAVVPAAPLDGDTWTAANFEWLLRVLGDPKVASRVEFWLADALGAIERDLQALEYAGLETPLEHLRQRQPTADHGPLRMVPYAVGAVALIARSLARHQIRHSQTFLSRKFNASHEAYEVAPQLFTRDLCLMDLLLLRREITAGRT